MNFVRLFFVMALVVFLQPASFTEAASLYIDPAIKTLNRGDAITMSIRLDTDEEVGECVNAVDAVITYTSNIEPVDVSIGDSILSMWVERPVINRENKTITFAGGIPNGYCGRVIGDPRLTNVLTRIVFRSPGFSIGGSSETNAEVSFGPETTAYLNDGRGTKADLALYGSKIELSQKPGTVMVNDWKGEVADDKTPPEEFSLSLQKDEKAFNGKYYVAFETTDKQTGVDHYEVMEEPLTQFGTFQWGRADAPWLRVKQPPFHVLEDQSLNSIIRVKAIDKAGNEYIANLIPDDSMRTISRGQLVTSLIVIASIVLLVALVVVWRYRRRKTQATLIDGEEDDGYEDETDDNEELK
ncbi:hypothetical protein KC926_01045 [Candidatus Kaiserbacteria bacterium]|nr:hypothetical protein [Candidatus Kaiserbacteria bacterium]